MLNWLTNRALVWKLLFINFLLVMTSQSSGYRKFNLAHQRLGKKLIQRQPLQRDLIDKDVNAVNKEIHINPPSRQNTKELNKPSPIRFNEGHDDPISENNATNQFSDNPNERLNSMRPKYSFKKIKSFNSEEMSAASLSSSDNFVPSSLSTTAYWVYTYTFTERFACADIANQLTLLTFATSLPWNQHVSMLEAYRMTSCYQLNYRKPNEGDSIKMQKSIMFQTLKNGKYYSSFVLFCGLTLVAFQQTTSQ